MKHPVAAIGLWLLLAGAAHAQAVPDDTMAFQPNPGDFVKRADTGLTLLGSPFRVGGANLDWAVLRSDTGHAADMRVPTAYEVSDAVATLQAMGGGAARVLSAGVSAGCAPCLIPSPGLVNEAALQQVDLVLQAARDAGVKVIIPLIGPAVSCADDPVRDQECVFAQWHHVAPEAFFTDPAVKADFRRAVVAIVQHVNPHTGIALKDDPTILAWENCDACGAGIAPAIIAAWTEEIGSAIKGVDTHHLYENGAFAGRLAAGAIPAGLLALPSVDIIGDRVTPAAPGATTAPGDLRDAAENVAKAGRAYMIDAYGWTAKAWATPGDLEKFLLGVVKVRAISGALVTMLQGHADQGGYLPVPPATGDSARNSALYFPGMTTDAASAADMQARARAVRRFDYRMLEVPIPAFTTVDKPMILHVDHGRIVWRGAAGATVYSVERSADPHVDDTWKLLCDSCATDAAAPWQDPDMPKDKPWYRITPYNANGHEGMPSDPMQSK